MVRLEQSRFLLLGKTRSSDWGWWYQFMPAVAITKVTFGTVTHGWRRQLALKVNYRVQIGQDEDELVETVLSFDTEELRLLAWTNLTQEMREHPTTG